MKSETGPCTHGGQERQKKELLYSRLVDGQFNKQGNLHTILLLDGHNMNRSLHPCTRICKVYRDALTGFSHMCHPDELNSTLLSQVFVLENVSHNRKSGQDIHSKDKGGDKEPLIARSSL